MWSRLDVAAAAAGVTTLLLSGACSASTTATSAAAFSLSPPLSLTAATSIRPRFHHCGSERPCPVPPLRRRCDRNGRLRRRGDGAVSLSMGFRSFIKKRIFKKDGGDGAEAGGIDEDPSSIDAARHSPDLSDFAESSLGSSGEPFSRSVDDEDGGGPLNYGLTTTEATRLRFQEDARERIHRMQGGGMTEEEKSSFLNAALTRNLGGESKRRRGPPIRQRIPGGEKSTGDDEDEYFDGEDDDSKEGEEDGGGGNGRGGVNDSSSKSSQSSLWNAIAGRVDVQSRGKDGRSSGNVPSSGFPDSPLVLASGGKLRNEEAKRQWIDSVTDPRRFASFSSVKQGRASQSAADSADTEGDGSATEEMGVPKSDFADMKRRIANDQERFLPSPSPQRESEEGSESVREALRSIQSMKENRGGGRGAEGSEANLAARLERAALAQERRDAEARAVATEAATRKREEEKRALDVLQKERERAFLEKEARRAEEMKNAQEQLSREEEARLNEERARLESMQAQQDAYWARQLEKEKEKRERGMTTEERGMSRASQNEERAKIEDIEREEMREVEILNEAEVDTLRDRELVRDSGNESAAPVSRTVLPPRTRGGDTSASKFIRQQRRKVAEIEQLAQMQQEQLKALNSPLPSLKKTPVAMPPSSPPPRMKERAPLPPPRTVSTPPRPAPVPAAPAGSLPPGLSLAALTMKKSDGGGSGRSPAPLPLPVPVVTGGNQPSPQLSLNELTRLKKDDTDAASPPPPPRLNLFEMTKLRKDDGKRAEVVKRPRPSAQPIRRSSVRQSLPITTRTDDEDDFVRSPDSAGLTIADMRRDDDDEGGGARKEGRSKQSAVDKAKQWGIDMSKFN